jgi:hypothetical protein
VAETLASFAGKVRKVESAFDGGPWLRAVARDIGEKSQALAAREASSDLGGDPKFSGWAPVLDTKFRVLGDGGTVSFSPTRSSAGPWTVSEVGRHQGNASGFAGPAMTRSGDAIGRTKSGGVRKTRARAGKRWNGRTQGKGTATRTVAAIEQMAPKEVNAEVGALLRKTF